jgi:hypothetical protein
LTTLLCGFEAFEQAGLFQAFADFQDIYFASASCCRMFLMHMMSLAIPSRRKIAYDSAVTTIDQENSNGLITGFV